MISGRRNESHSQQSQSLCMVVPHNNPNNNLADTIPVTLTTGSGAIRPLCVITDSTPEQISASGMNFSNVTTASKKIFFSTSTAASTNTNTSISQPTLLFASKSTAVGQTAAVHSSHVVNQNQIMIIPSNFSLNPQHTISTASHSQPQIQQHRFKAERDITDIKPFVPDTSSMYCMMIYKLFQILYLIFAHLLDVEQNFHSNESLLPRQYSSTSSKDSLNNNGNSNRYQNTICHIASGSQGYEGVAQSTPTTPTLIHSGSTQFPVSANYSVLQLPPGQLPISQHPQTQTLGKTKILLHSVPAANISGTANASATLLTLNSSQLQPLQSTNNASVSHPNIPTGSIILSSIIQNPSNISGSQSTRAVTKFAVPIGVATSNISQPHQQSIQVANMVTPGPGTFTFMPSGTGQFLPHATTTPVTMAMATKTSAKSSTVKKGKNTSVISARDSASQIIAGKSYYLKCQFQSLILFEL